MKTQDEIQKAHDLLVAILLGDVQHSFGNEAMGIMAAQASVLCWILEHNHNTKFADELAMIDALMAAKGYVLRREPPPMR